MSVTITKPASGATLTGLAVVEATYSGKNFEIATVTVDGQQLASDSSKPIAFSIDTTKVSDGSHTLTVAVRYRTAGGAQRWQKASIPITTKGNDMKVDLSTSGGVSNLSETVIVTAVVTPSAQAETPVSCKFSVDNGPVLSTDTSYPLTFSWNTTSVADGTHTLRAVVTAGPRTRQATGALGVSVKNIATPPPPPPPPPPPQATPVNQTVPVISDTTPQEGQTISATNGTWTNDPDSYTRQWVRCDVNGANCVAIPSATGISYTCSGDDVDSRLRCVVTAHNEVGASTPAQSAATTAVSAVAAAVPVLVSGGTPVLTGTSQVGNTLASSNGNWTQSPTSYNRQWKRCQPSPITSSINDGDTIVQGQVWTVTANPDATLVEFFADGSPLGTDASEPFQITLNLSLAAHQLGLAVTVGGVRTVLTETESAGVFAAVTCSAGPAVVTGAGDSIAGATSATYVAASADVGKTLRCLTTAVNATGSSVPVQTEQTATVTSGAPPPPPPPTGYYRSETWESGVVPTGWSVEQKQWPSGQNNANAQYAFVTDPFGAGQGKVLRLRIQYDAALPINYSQRLLSAIYMTEGGAHTALNEETWYRVKVGFPTGNVYANGQWQWVVEWHTDGNTQSQGGNSPGLAIEGNYPLTPGGTTSPRGLACVWRAGTPASPTETYWPSSGSGAFNDLQFIPITPGRYYDSVWRIIWSNSAVTGRLDWWLDGSLKVGRNMATLYTNANNASGVSTHGFGLYNYRYNISGMSDFYFGDFIMGPTAASVGL